MELPAGIFKTIIDSTHPYVDFRKDPPSHTLIFQASMEREKKNVSQTFHDAMVTKLKLMM